MPKLKREKPVKSDPKAERKRQFVRALAEFLVGDQVSKSVQLEMGSESAKEWGKLRSTTPLFGYPTINEAEKELADWLGI